MKSYLPLLFLCISSLLQAQPFYKIYDFTPQIDHAAYQVKKIKNNEYVVSYFSTCGDPKLKCCGLFTIDGQGKLLQKNQIPKFSNSTRALLVDTTNNRILYCGEKSIFQEYAAEIVINEIPINNLQEKKQHSYSDAKNDYFVVSQTASIIYNNRLVVGGVGGVEYPAVVDTSNSFVYFFNQDLQLDTALYFQFSTSINNQLWEIYEDAQGYLTMHFYHNDRNRYVRIVKIDKEYKIVFDWETEIKADNNRPRGCSMRDGRILLVTSNYPQSNVTLMRAINHDGTISWAKSWPYHNADKIRINYLKQVENNDIVGCGGFQDSINDSWMPFIFRMNQEGELLWEKAFYNIKNKITNSFGDFGEVIETENGDFIAVGLINQRLSLGPNHFDDQDIFIVRVDSEGCLNESCETVTGVENIVVGSIDVMPNRKEVDISIYPNPVYNSELNIDLKIEGNFKNLRADLLDIYGRKVADIGLRNGYNKFDGSNINVGVYLMKIIDDVDIIKIQKVVFAK